MELPALKINDSISETILTIGKQQKSIANGKSENITTNKKRFKIRPMYYAAVSCLLMTLSVGLSTGFSAAGTYDMEHRESSRVKPNKYEVTWIGSIVALGGMLGSIVTGPLADKIGRKDTLVYNLLPFAVGFLIICYATSASIVIFGRFINGVATGVASVVVPMYCVEISTAEVRGIFGTAFQGFLVIGNLLSAILGAFITWEYLSLTGAMFVTFAVICFLPMPETPRWLIAHDKLDDAIFVMDKLQNGTINAEEECKTIHKDLQESPKGRLSLDECKHPTVYKPALIALILMFFHQFSGSNAVIFYSSKIFEVAKDFMDPQKSTIILAAVQVFGNLISNLTVEKAGRRILLISSGILTALSHTALGTYYYMSSGNASFQSKYNWIPLTSLISFLIAFSSGFGPVPWLLTAEMMPIRARSTVVGTIAFFNGLFAFTVTKTFSELEDLIGNAGTFWFYSFMCISGTVFVFFFVPETKGKKLEDIENLFQAKTSN